MWEYEKLVVGSTTDGRGVDRGLPARSPNSTDAKPRRRRLSPYERKAEPLALALSVFAKRGIGRATHAEAAEAAGCSLATVFVYLPRREDLVSAVLDEVESFYMQMGLDEDAARLLIGAAHMLAQMKFGGQSEEKIDRFVRTIATVAFGPKR